MRTRTSDMELVEKDERLLTFCIVSLFVSL
jgi:hypothetical protein